MKAFPYSNDEDKQYHWINHGMDLRDYFAAKAMQGPFSDIYGFTNEELAKAAYGLADAMMKAREQK